MPSPIGLRPPGPLSTPKPVAAGGQAPPAAAPQEAQAPRASFPPNLVDFMKKGWAAAPDAPPPVVANAAAYQARRDSLSKQFPNDTLIVPSGGEKVRSNDTDYRFRPGTDFYYLTGNVEPDSVLVLVPKEGGGHRSVLFVQESYGHTDPRSYTDPNGEIWVGPRMTLDQYREHYNVDECRSLSDLPSFLEGCKGCRVLRGMDEAVDRAVAPDAPRDGELATALGDMRLTKDPSEIEQLQKAVDDTQRGFEEVIRKLPGATSERTVEATFDYAARTQGNDVGYGTIAAAGTHAVTLHWEQDDGPMKPGDLLLLDAGVEENSLYTADITRTLPVSGTYTPEQRQIYDLVHSAQAAGLAEVKPGNDFRAPHRAAMKVLAEGLEKLGILPSAADALKDENQFYRRYTLHGVSHMLGLDVHDCDTARDADYHDGKLRPGMVMTVEPGLYFQPDDLTVPPQYRGIGVRIEDDVLVTPDGHRVLSAAIPSSSSDVEAWMAKVRAQA